MNQPLRTNSIQLRIRWSDGSSDCQGLPNAWGQRSEGGCASLGHQNIGAALGKWGSWGARRGTRCPRWSPICLAVPGDWLRPASPSVHTFSAEVRVCKVECLGRGTWSPKDGSGLRATELCIQTQVSPLQTSCFTSREPLRPAGHQ